MSDEFPVIQLGYILALGCVVAASLTFLLAPIERDDDYPPYA